MTAKGNATNITAIRQTSQVASNSKTGEELKAASTPVAFESLAYRPKPGNR